MYRYKCELDRVVDGDTVDAHIDLGFGLSLFKRIRLYGINAPETRTKDIHEKERGLVSKKYLTEMLLINDGEFIVETKKDDTGKYGRLLGTIIVDGININEQMVNLGYAVDYMKD